MNIIKAREIARKFVNCERMILRCSKLCKTCHYDYEMEQLVEAVKALLKEVERGQKNN